MTRYYLDTGDRVVVRDSENLPYKFVILLNEQCLGVPSVTVAKHIYDGLRELLISHGQLERSPET